MVGVVLQFLREQALPHIQRTFLAQPLMSATFCCITFCNDTMQTWAESCVSGSVLVLDTSFGTNKYGLHLLGAHGIDDRGRALPVLFALMVSESAEAIGMALRQFRARMQQRTRQAEWAPQCAITDKSAAEQHAIRHAFLPACYQAHAHAYHRMPEGLWSRAAATPMVVRVDMHTPSIFSHHAAACAHASMCLRLQATPLPAWFMPPVLH